MCSSNLVNLLKFEDLMHGNKYFAQSSSGGKNVYKCLQIKERRIWTATLLECLLTPLTVSLVTHGLTLVLPTVQCCPTYLLTTKVWCVDALDKLSVDKRSRPLPLTVTCTCNTTNVHMLAASLIHRPRPSGKRQSHMSVLWLPGWAGLRLGSTQWLLLHTNSYKNMYNGSLKLASSWSWTDSTKSNLKSLCNV